MVIDQFLFLAANPFGRKRRDLWDHMYSEEENIERINTNPAMNPEDVVSRVKRQSKILTIFPLHTILNNIESLGDLFND